MKLDMKISINDIKGKGKRSENNDGNRKEEWHCLMNIVVRSSIVCNS
jgi:hypothetical protein